MARDKLTNTGDDSTPADAVTEAADPAAAAAANAAPTAGAATVTEATVGDDRYIYVKKTDGSKVQRLGYIRELWAGGNLTRGQIAKHLTELNTVANGGNGKKVPYQIVFAATKGKPGGPPKVVEGAPAVGETVTTTTESTTISGS